MVTVMSIHAHLCARLLFSSARTVELTALCLQQTVLAKAVGALIGEAVDTNAPRTGDDWTTHACNGKKLRHGSSSRSASLIRENVIMFNPGN